MNPTENEFREIFRIRQQLDSEFDPRIQPETPEETFRKYKLEAGVRQQIQTLLGADRYLDFQRASDPGFKLFSQFSDSHGIERSEVVELYNLTRQVQEASRKIRASSSTAPTGTDPAIVQIETEAINELRRRLGDSLANQFLKTSGDAWLSVVRSTGAGGVGRSTTVLRLPAP